MRDPQAPADSFRIGEWCVEPSLNALSRGAEHVTIEPRTMNVLAYLAQRAGSVVSQSELEQNVWKEVVVTPQSVYQSIAQLRRVLGDDARDPRYIATVSRRGYRLIATVSEAGAPAAAAATSTPSSELPRRRWFRRRRDAVAASIVVALLIAGASAVLRAYRTPPEHGPISIAVLPFADLSAKHDNEPFCDGLTDELSSALSQLSEVRVIARNSTYQFRDPNRDLRAIGSRLGVSHLLQGSVRRDANHLRVIASLVDAQSGAQLWSRSIDKGSDEILRVQQEIATDVVSALELRLSPQSAERLNKQRTASPNAYELYLLGRYQQLKREPAALERAVAYQKEALSLDPSFALAYAGLADAHIALYFYKSLPLEQSAPEIEDDIRHALALDAGLAEAYSSRGVLRTEQWRLDEAVADLEKAIVLKPNNGEALIRLGAAHEYRGEPREALKQFDQAISLDPLHFILHIRRCLTLQNMGRYAEATQSCERSVQLQPDNPNGYWTTGLVALSHGDLAQAEVGYEKALEKAPWRIDLLLQLGWIDLDDGKPDVARGHFDSAFKQKAGNTNLVALESARFFVATGNSTDLANYLDGVDLGALKEPRELVDAALLEMTAGRPQAAHALVQRARARIAPGESAVFENVWQARWGDSLRVTLALDARANGDPGEAERQLAALERWLDMLEANGQVWHGAKYLRAEVLALRGRKPEALAALADAVRLGWRRAWWTRVDPAFAAIRDEGAFAAQLERMRAQPAMTRSAHAPTR